MFGNNNSTPRCPSCGAIMEPMADLQFGVTTVVEYECPLCGHVVPAKFVKEAGTLERLVKAYHILGLEPGVDFEMVTSAYKNLAKKFHPDLYPPEKRDVAEERMKKINEAYEMIKRVYSEVTSKPKKKKRVADKKIFFSCINLGIKPTYYADELNVEEIESAYRKKVKEHHPDAGGYAETFIRIKESYDYLKSVLQE